MEEVSNGRGRVRTNPYEKGRRLGRARLGEGGRVGSIVGVRSEEVWEATGGMRASGEDWSPTGRLCVAASRACP